MNLFWFYNPYDNSSYVSAPIEVVLFGSQVFYRDSTDTVYPRLSFGHRGSHHKGTNNVKNQESIQQKCVPTCLGAVGSSQPSIRHRSNTLQTRRLLLHYFLQINLQIICSVLVMNKELVLQFYSNHACWVNFSCCNQ